MRKHLTKEEIRELKRIAKTIGKLEGAITVVRDLKAKRIVLILSRENAIKLGPVKEKTIINISSDADMYDGESLFTMAVLCGLRRVHKFVGCEDRITEDYIASIINSEVDM